MSSLRQSYISIANPTRVPLAQPLTINGELGGDDDMAVDGSVTPVEFYYAPGPNEMATIFDFSIQIGDAGNTTEDDYGSIAGPLTNGLQFYAILGGVEVDFGPPVVRAAQFFARGGVVLFTELSGNKRVADYKFSFFGPTDGTRLDGRNGDVFGAKVRDNLSSLSIHTIAIGGNMQIIEGS